MVSDLIDEYSATFAVYEIHWYDAYSTTWGTERGAFYGNITAGVPWMGYDGLGNTLAIAEYEQDLNLRQAVPTDVTIELSGTESGVQTYDITAEVCVEPGGVGKTMRVYMVHALDRWPASPTYERNTLRQAATTQDVTVASGECAEVTRTFVLDATSWAQQSDIRIVAWAQTPNASYPAEVHQARVMSWPFPPAGEIFDNGFEDGTTDDWSSAVP